MPERWTEAEWGLVVTTVAGACAAVWKWLTNRQRDQETLDDSRIATLSKSWKLQQNLAKFWEDRFSALTAENGALQQRLTNLEAEHAKCERKTDRLAQQNAEQAEQIKRLSAEVERLKYSSRSPSG